MRINLILSALFMFGGWTIAIVGVLFPPLLILAALMIAVALWLK